MADKHEGHCIRSIQCGIAYYVHDDIVRLNRFGTQHGGDIVVVFCILGHLKQLFEMAR